MEEKIPFILRSQVTRYAIEEDKTPPSEGNPPENKSGEPKPPEKKKNKQETNLLMALGVALGSTIFHFNIYSFVFSFIVAFIVVSTMSFLFGKDTKK